MRGTASPTASGTWMKLTPHVAWQPLQRTEVASNCTAKSSASSASAAAFSAGMCSSRSAKYIWSTISSSQEPGSSACVISASKSSASSWAWYAASCQRLASAARPALSKRWAVSIITMPMRGRGMSTAGAEGLSGPHPPTRRRQSNTSLAHHRMVREPTAWGPIQEIEVPGKRVDWRDPAPIERFKCSSPPQCSPSLTS